MNFLTNVVMGCKTVATCAVAFFTGETTPPSLDQILGSVNALFDFGISIFDRMLAHPILLILFGVGFIGIGVGVVRKLIRLAKH